MNPQEKAALELRDALRECFELMRFARATELAQSRRYLEAEGLLSPNGRESSDPKELDLLARIAAQQRQYGLARRRWETALQQSPDNADYRRAIERAKKAEHFQAMIRKGVRIAVLFFAMLSLSVAISHFLPRPSLVVPSNLPPPLPISKSTPLPISEPRQRPITELAPPPQPVFSPPIPPPAIPPTEALESQ